MYEMTQAELEVERVKFYKMTKAELEVERVKFYKMTKAELENVISRFSLLSGNSCFVNPVLALRSGPCVISPFAIEHGSRQGEVN